MDYDECVHLPEGHPNVLYGIPLYRIHKNDILTCLKPSKARSLPRVMCISTT